MIKVLDVYFHQKMIGKLIQDRHGEMSFSYSQSWLNDPQATHISYSMPLQEKPFNKKICHAFFGGILPEEHQRKLIAKNLGISANNDFSMLEKIGGECAGALSFLPSGQPPLSSEKDEYHAVADEELLHLLQELPSRPLLAGEEGVRLSLAGVQDKLAIFLDQGKMFLPLQNAPSTHILKPAFNIYEGLIFNELFCLKLAKAVGISAAEAEIKKAGDIEYLLIKRYDRTITNDKNKKITRIHQEDFCQALGIPSENKYQNEGGPTFKQCFDLIRKEFATPAIALEKMLNAVILNYLIGNCDAHGKNFSILYRDTPELAPLYDVVCTDCYAELSKKMAMKLGGEYHVDHIRVQHFDKLADELGFSKTEMQKRIRLLIDAILAALPKLEITHRIQIHVADIIRKRCTLFTKDKKI